MALTDIQKEDAELLGFSQAHLQTYELVVDTGRPFMERYQALLALKETLKDTLRATHDGVRLGVAWLTRAENVLGGLTGGDAGRQAEREQRKKQLVGSRDEILRSEEYAPAERAFNDLGSIALAPVGAERTRYGARREFLHEVGTLLLTSIGEKWPTLEDAKVQRLMGHLDLAGVRSLADTDVAHIVERLREVVERATESVSLDTELAGLVTAATPVATRNHLKQVIHSLCAIVALERFPDYTLKLSPESVPAITKRVDPAKGAQIYADYRELSTLPAPCSVQATVHDRVVDFYFESADAAHIPAEIRDLCENVGAKVRYVDYVRDADFLRVLADASSVDTVEVTLVDAHPTHGGAAVVLRGRDENDGFDVVSVGPNPPDDATKRAIHDQILAAPFRWVKRGYTSSLSRP